MSRAVAGLLSAVPAIMLAVLVGVAAIPAGPHGLYGNVVPPASGAIDGLSSGTATTLTVGASVGVHSATPFWGLNTEDAFTAGTQARLGDYLNSTPVTVIRLGGGNDGYDPTTNVAYQAPPSGSGTYVGVSEVLVNFTWFKAWCDSRTPHCVWMTYLPGEENSSQAAVHVAEYFHSVLRFVPTYWEFGNEPLAWTHYGLIRSVWSTTDASYVSGTGYATMVHDYISAVRALYPTDHFVGIQNSCACNPSLITTLTKVDGAQLSSLAFHEYPWINGSRTSASQFFGTLASSRNIPNATAHMESMMAAGCTGCGHLPISIGEYQAGPVPNHSPLAMNFSGAPFIAASVIQALEDNVTTFTIFSIGWLFNTSNGFLGSEGYLYQRLFSNMTMGTDYAVSVKAIGVGGVYCLLIKNGTHASLLLVNTNVTHSLSLSLTSAVFAVGLTGSYYYYAPTMTQPAAHASVTLPRSYGIGPQGILLLDNY